MVNVSNHIPAQAGIQGRRGPPSPQRRTPTRFPSTSSPSASNANKSAVRAFSALAMARMFFNDGLRCPRSIPDRYVGWMLAS